MFGIGGFEFFLILIFGFLIFGPERLPEMAKTLGKAIAKFRSMQSELDDVVKTEIYDPHAAGVPYENPIQALEQMANPQQPVKEDEQKNQRKAQYEEQRARIKAQALERENEKQKLQAESKKESKDVSADQESKSSDSVADLYSSEALCSSQEKKEG